MIASAEIVSILFLVIILGSLCSGWKQQSKGNRLFFAFVLSTMLGLLCDASSYIADALCTSKILLIIINVLAFSMLNVCIVLYSLYMIYMVRQTKNVSFKWIHPIIALSTLNVLGILVGVITGQFFSVENGRLVYGPWNDFITVMPVLSMIFLFVILLMNMKYLGRRNALALSSFVVFPLISAFAVVFYPDLELAYLAGALSAAIIFTFIRREEIVEAHVREQIMAKVSTVDSLTGLLNRRGYKEALELIDTEHRVGIVFCDLNELKTTNDTLGHAAGDAYICRFADILRQVFDETAKICRISGDEFIVLLEDTTSEQMAEHKNKLNEKIAENNRIASVGYAIGDHVPVMDLINRAEHEMYDDKSRYYTETGHDRRRR